MIAMKKTNKGGVAFIFFILILLLPLRSAAQIKLTPEQSGDKLVADKIGRRFILNEPLKAVNGRVYDFSHIRKPAFIYIGQEYCLVCKFEFPAFLEMVKQFPDIDFIYLSADPDSVIRRKAGNATERENLYAISVETHYLWDQDIAKVYPVKYFLNKDGIVIDAATGGQMKDRESVKAAWLKIIGKLQ